MELRKIGISFIFIFLITKVFGQEVSLQTKLDTQNIVIGDWINYSFQLSQDKNTKVIWPEISDSLGKFEVIQSSPIDTVKKDGKLQLSKKIVFSAFEDGTFTVPSFKFQYKKINDTAIKALETDTYQVVVNAMAVDTAQPIKPINEPLEVPVTLKELLPYIGGGILLIGLIILIIFLIRKNRRKEIPVKKTIIKRAPHEIAIEKLTELEKEKMWQKGKVKEYHDRVTDIVREYLALRFQIPALEQTTDEIIQNLEYRRIGSEQIEKLTEIFRLADLAKFAKAEPLPQENERSIKVAFDFVRNTIESEIKKEVEEKQVNDAGA